MKRAARNIAYLLLALLLAGAGYFLALVQGHRDPLPGDVGQPMQASMAVYERVQGTGVLRCGYYDQPPFIVRGDKPDMPEGIMPPILQHALMLTGLQVQFVESSPAGLHDDIEVGRVDAQCFMPAPSPLMARDLDHGQLLLAMQQLPYVAMNSPLKPDANLNQDTVRIASLPQSMAAYLQARHYRRAKNIDDAQNVTEQLLKVANGEADVAISDPVSVEAFNAAHPDKKLRALSRVPLQVTSYHVLTARGDSAMRMMIDDALRFHLLQGRLATEIHRLDSSGKLIYLPASPIVTPSVH